MLRALLILIGLALVAVAGTYAYRRATFDRGAWREDFAHLIDHTSKVYANLDWAPERGVDLPHLKRVAEDGIENARTDDEARAVIVEFARGFRDPHYEVPRVKLSKRVERWWRELRSGDGDRKVPSSSNSGEEAVALLGFSPRGLEPRFDFDEQTGRVMPPPRAEDAELPTVVVRLRSAETIGIIRVGSFSERSFPAIGAAAWEAHRATFSGDCGEDCANDFVYGGVSNALIAAVGRRIEQLRGEKVDAIAVDLTGNGGGTDWATGAARLFAPPPVRGERLAVAKHPHWSTQFERIVSELDQALKGTQLTAADRALVIEARARADRLRTEAATACDRSALFSSGGKPGCKGITEGEYYATGLFAHVPPGALKDAEVRVRLDKTLQYALQEGMWTGPVFLLVDERTASAAEQFAAMLLDSGGAKAIGARTAGAGCGYTRGGAFAKLPNSGLEVKMSDCARLRSDGTNEISGITPDAAIRWSEDPRERGDQLIDALEQLPLEKAPAPPGPQERAATPASDAGMGPTPDAGLAPKR